METESRARRSRGAAPQRGGGGARRKRQPAASRRLPPSASVDTDCAAFVATALHPRVCRGAHPPDARPRRAHMRRRSRALPCAPAEVVLSDDDDDFVYEEVEVEEADDDDAVSEDLEAALRSLQPPNAGGDAGPSAAGPEEDGTSTRVTRLPEVVDDFIRNFLVRMGMHRTLETFETEWYELGTQGQIDNGQVGAVPDVYMKNQELEDAARALNAELGAAKAIAAKATSTWDKFRKERDFHRMQHRRVGQEKNKLVTDLKRLKAHYAQYEPTIKELRHKYEAAMKEKMLATLERDRMVQKVEAMESTMKSLPGGGAAGAQQQQAARAEKDGARGGSGGMQGGKAPAASRGGKAGGKTLRGGASLPPDTRDNPHAYAIVPPVEASRLALRKTFKGHLMSVSSVVMHPKKPIVATASDDRSWKMWGLPDGELIMSGDGHRDWVSGVDFHPRGAHLVSSSGDCTVKLWDFEASRCVLTLSEHTQAVWDVAMHECGDFVASCSLDHSARLWDLTAARCRQTFRGHVDSVNALAWMPCTNTLCTGSSDKTVSLWDARSGLCVQTFCGHLNSCNHVAFNAQADTVASTDADGVVKLWDVRMVAERASAEAGSHPANKCCFDRSGEVLAVASDDATVKVYSLDAGGLELVRELEGHEDAVQACVFDSSGSLITAGSDNTFRLFG